MHNGETISLLPNDLMFSVEVVEDEDIEMNAEETETASNKNDGAMKDDSNSNHRIIEEDNGKFHHPSRYIVVADRIFFYENEFTQNVAASFSSPFCYPIFYYDYVS